MNVLSLLTHVVPRWVEVSKNKESELKSYPSHFCLTPHKLFDVFPLVIIAIMEL